jgi:hypothetical protein
LEALENSKKMKIIILIVFDWPTILIDSSGEPYTISLNIVHFFKIIGEDGGVLSTSNPWKFGCDKYYSG